LVDRIKRWRTGAVTGAGLTENNIKMTGALIAPILVIWAGVKMFLPDTAYDLAMSLAMGGWLVWIVCLYSWAKSDSGNYICFPQSKWKFRDGSCRTFDLKVPPDSWEKILEFPDGSVGYKVGFADKYAYDDPDLPFPRIFKKAYWLVPALWDTSFQRRAYGEFFHKGVYVTKPDCEDISVYVVGWKTIDGEDIPKCIINDCAFTYEKVLASATLNPVANWQLSGMALLYKDALKKIQKVEQHAGYLEDRLLIAEKESSKDFKDSADHRMKAVRKRHARIMDTQPSLLSRLINMKTMAFVLLFIFAVFLFGRLIMRWW